MDISPFAPSSFPQLTAIKGMKITGVAAELRYKNRPDVMLALFEKEASVAGVFTRSKCPSAPVDWCRKALAQGKARAVLVNAGNANAFSGKKGEVAVEVSANAVANAIGCADNEVFLASTGVIGEPLNADAMKKAVQLAYQSINNQQEQDVIPHWEAATKAIMTTDTFPKAICETVMIEGQDITIQGIVKGSGMIAPDMATMLGFIFTDANISSSTLQSLLSHVTEESYNAITVDSDTSTSDTILAFATKATQTAKLTEKHPDFTAFADAFTRVNKNLARQVVMDGEGISKLLEITVSGAVSNASAKKIALSIGNSPLVKTAAAGEDANWGRIVMAVGKAGEEAERDKLAIYFGEECLARDGERVDDYDEAKATAIMQQSIIPIRVEMGLGTGEATILASDFTHAYISINGDYRS